MIECVQNIELEYNSTTMVAHETLNQLSTKLDSHPKETAKNETLSQRKSIPKLSKTKKKKSNLNKVDKDAMWDIFDKDIQNIKESELINQPIQEQNLDVCYSCNSSLFI